MRIDILRTLHCTGLLKSVIMFKLLILSCLLAASIQGKTLPSPAVPYYPQPYQSVYPQQNQPVYPQGYPQFYSAQPKYSVQPAYVAAAAPYSPAGYRQVFIPANPAYNPYYNGYTPYPAYPQPYPYPYAPVNDGTQPAAAQPGWGEYFSNFWNYVPNFPSFTSESQTSEAENSASSAAETSSSAAEPAPVKGDKPTDGQKTEQKPISDGQSTEQAPFKQFAPASPFLYFGQPQFYNQLPYQQTVYDPSKLNAVKNGAVSSYLFNRNQPQLPVFQQYQMSADQKYIQASAPQSNQGTAALAYHRYLQFQKQPQQQDQSFQQQPFQQQQYDQQHQQEESSVVVDSNANGVQVNDEGQQQAQPKLATGPTVAVAHPLGIAFAGIGGRAGAGPVGTAIVGKNSTAIAGPSATAISLDLTPTINLTPVHKLTTAYVAKYSPELGVYRVAEIKSS